MNSIKKTSIVDVPRYAGADDLLKIDVYSKSLENFISKADTPLTIAIQGEWGSGKTSMMNQLQENLCNGENSRFYGIWINTWQYALLSDEEIILTRIVNGVTDHTIKAIRNRNPGKYNDSIDKVKNVGKALFKGVLKFGVDKVAGDTGVQVVDEIFTGGASDVTINDLRSNLKDVISRAITDDEARRGFIFFIDDLDRIEPIVAVQILELFKNIFDLPYCIFILAIDYDVVVKGLEPKFGKFTEKNEREFRSFFDKIIQLPFTMPVHRYDIDDFIIKILDQVGYLSDREIKDENFRRTISMMANYSVGKNPRSLKRLVNSLSLIKIFNDLDETKDRKNDEPHEKLMNIGLICCQIAYPFIYNTLNRDPDFKNWNHGTAAKLKLKPLTDEEIEALNQTEEFDEDWEKVLYRACQSDPYLSKNVFRISAMLNLIADQVPPKMAHELGTIIDSLLSLSSVTNIEATQDGVKSIAMRGKFSGFDEFCRNMDPGGKHQDFTDLIRYVHDDILKTYSKVEVSYSKGRLAFFDNDIQRKAKTFLTLLVSSPPVKVRIEKEATDEALPPGSDEHWLKRDQWKYFDFKLNSKEDYNDTVRKYIKRNYDLALKGFILQET